MNQQDNSIRDLFLRLERFGEEVGNIIDCAVRRSEFVALCDRYNALARETSEDLGRQFPSREPRQADFGFVPGVVRHEAVAELVGLAKALVVAVRRAMAGGAMPCPKAAGRPCQMYGEIDTGRFDVFFAIPFRTPSTCKEACDALIEWLEGERGIDEKHVFRADRWTYSGDFVCKICKAIQESRVIVADITGGNPNVFFELGMAVGLGKPVVLIHDEKVTEGRVPSDLLAWEYVPYDGRNPAGKEWLEHFGVVFDGTRNRM